MYKITGLFLLVLCLGSCKKDETPGDTNPTFPSAEMQPVFYCFTATWDSISGKQGKPAMDSLRLRNPNAVIINCHLNEINGKIDPLSNTWSQGLADFYSIQVPKDSLYALPYVYFAYNGQLGGMNYTGLSAFSQQVVLDWTQENIEPAMTMVIEPTITGNSLNVSIDYKSVYSFPTKVLFSVLLTENNLSSPQVADLSIKPNVHDDVLRKCLTEYNGDFVANSLNVNQTGNFSIQTILDNTWNTDELYVNVLVWYYDPVYGNMVHLAKRQKVK